MKIRTDFVTNSSSSSFILGKPFDKEWTKERILKWFRDAANEVYNTFINIENDIRKVDIHYYNKLVNALKINNWVWIDNIEQESLDDYERRFENTYNIFRKLYDDARFRVILDKHVDNMKILKCSSYDLYSTYSSSRHLYKIYIMTKIKTLEELESIIEMKIVDMELDINNIDINDWDFQEVYEWYNFREHFDFNDVRTIGKILIYKGEEGYIPHILAKNLLRISEYGCTHMG